MYGLLCGLARAVAVKLWNKLWYCRIHGCYTEREMSRPSAAVKLNLSSQIIASKLLYLLLHFNYSQ